MPDIVIAIAFALLLFGVMLASRWFKNPLAIIFGGLAIGAVLCALVFGIFFAGCILLLGGFMKGF